MREAVEVNDRWAVLDSAELSLREAEPTGHDFLGQWVTTVVRVAAVGPDGPSQVTFGQRLPDRPVVPEGVWQGRR